jgi:large subunit ribosomal protein L17
MRHRMRGRQLSRDTEHRQALRRHLVQSLFEHGKIRTTHPKAKEVRAFAEKLITLARLKTLNARRRVIQLLHDRRLVDKEQEFIPNAKGNPTTLIQRLFDEVAPRFVGRNGGYTRIIKLPEHRIGDGGSLVLLQLLTEEAKPTGTPRKSAGLRRKRNEKRRQFAGKLEKKEAAAKEPAKEAGPAAE